MTTNRSRDHFKTIYKGKDLEERLREWDIVFNLVEEFYNDHRKALRWFSTPHPVLDFKTPESMIVLGHFEKLHELIQTAIIEEK